MPETAVAPRAHPQPIAAAIPEVVAVTETRGDFVWDDGPFDSATVGWGIYFDRNLADMLPASVTNAGSEQFVCQFMNEFHRELDSAVRVLDSLTPPPEVVAAVRQAWAKARAEMMDWTGEDA